MEQLNLFDDDAETIQDKKKNVLGEMFGECPFSVLNAQKGEWQKKKKQWLSLGIDQNAGRDVALFNKEINNRRGFGKCYNQSVFDPYLSEVLYRWFCPQNGKILDPFAGGSVRGIVANSIGYKYTGIDIRLQQITADIKQAETILKDKEKPLYICGDSDKVLEDLNDEFDFVFSCPPYGDLEVYSDLEGDISNMNYDSFIKAYKSIIKKSCKLLKKDCFACFVVSQFRDKNGAYVGFVADTVKAFQEVGMLFWNDMIYLQPICSAAFRAGTPFKKNRKTTRIHQNILVFKKI